MIGNNSENRNCNCNNNNNNMTTYNCDYDPEGINASYGYNTVAELDNNDNYMIMNNNDQESTREEMIQEIKELNFAVIELGLYLNTHNNDRRALCLHREYCKRLKDLKDKYQKVYGPLSIYYPCNKWRWLEEPWPWEGGNY